MRWPLLFLPIVLASPVQVRRALVHNETDQLETLQTGFITWTESGIDYRFEYKQFGSTEVADRQARVALSDTTIAQFLELKGDNALLVGLPEDVAVIKKDTDSRLGLIGTCGPKCVGSITTTYCFSSRTLTYHLDISPNTVMALWHQMQQKMRAGEILGAWYGDIMAQLVIGPKAIARIGWMGVFDSWQQLEVAA